MADWYASALAGGGGDGSIGNPWTASEAETAVNTGVTSDGDTVHFKKDAIYLTSGLVFTNPGSAAGVNRIAGYGVSIGDGIRPIIRRNGGAGDLVQINPSEYWACEDFELDSQNTGVYCLSMEDRSRAKNIEAYGGGSGGISSSSIVLRCYSHDNAGFGIINGSTKGTTCLCIVKDNGSYGIYAGIGHSFDIAVGNVGNFQALTNHGIAYSFCISDGGTGDGFNVDTAFLINCIVVNAPAGKEGIMANWPNATQALNCVFNGNDSKTNRAEILIDDTDADPQFVDSANLDYRIQNADIEDLGLSGLGLLAINYGLTPGIDQKRKCVLPSAAEVLLGTSYTDHGVEETGTLQAYSYELPVEVDAAEDAEISLEIEVEA